MGLVVVTEGIVLPFDHLQARHTTHFRNCFPGNPGEKSRVVLGLFPALAYETSVWKQC
jgi:hypothetical protein